MIDNINNKANIVSRKNASAGNIMEQLLQYIASSGIKPGSMLPSERELSKTLKISRLPLRETLAQLKLMGFVKSNKGSGTRLSEIDTKTLFSLMSTIMSTQDQLDLMELLQARRIWEIPVAKYAAFYREQEDIMQLENILKSMRKYLGWHEKFMCMEMEFRCSLARSSKNHIINIIMEFLLSLSKETRKFLPDDIEYRKAALNFYAKIFEAVKMKDAEQAGRFMEKHIDNIQERILGVFNRVIKKRRRRNSRETEESYEMAHL